MCHTLQFLPINASSFVQVVLFLFGSSNIFVYRVPSVCRENERAGFVSSPLDAQQILWTLDSVDD